MPKLEEKPNEEAVQPKEKAEKAKPKQKVERKVLFPEPEAYLCVGDQALTVDNVKELLGWTDDAKLAKEHDAGEYLLTDLNEKKVWLLNNIKNRPLYMNLVEAYAQEHLQRRWKFNGETIIIGKTGLVENGQHQMIGLVLAEQMRVKDASGAQHWVKNWPGPVTMEKVVVYGVDEDDATINTMDTCKPRSFADVIYRSEYFKSMKSDQRRTAGKLTDFAVRELWSRTGAGVNHWVTKRTHAEGLDFLNRHPRLLRCVKHIMEEDGKKDDKGAIRRYFPPGTAAGLLYLMATCDEDGDAYRHREPPSEKGIKFAYWDKACEFWVRISTRDPAMDPVFKALGYLADEDTLSGGKTRDKRAIIIKAWNVFKEGHSISPSDVKLKYDIDEATDVKTLSAEDKAATVGGLDLVEEVKQDDDEEPSEDNPEVVKKRAEEIRKEKAAEVAAKIEQRRASGKYGKGGKDGGESGEAPQDADPSENGEPEESAPKPKKGSGKK